MWGESPVLKGRAAVERPQRAVWCQPRRKRRGWLPVCRLQTPAERAHAPAKFGAKSTLKQFPQIADNDLRTLGANGGFGGGAGRDTRERENGVRARPVADRNVGV